MSFQAHSGQAACYHASKAATDSPVETESLLVKLKTDYAKLLRELVLLGFFLMHFMGFVSITLEFSFHGAWRVRSYDEQYSGIAAACLRSHWLSSVCYLKYFSPPPSFKKKRR